MKFPDDMTTLAPSPMQIPECSEEVSSILESVRPFVVHQLTETEKWDSVTMGHLCKDVEKRIGDRQDKLSAKQRIELIKTRRRCRVMIIKILKLQDRWRNLKYRENGEVSKEMTINNFIRVICANTGITECPKDDPNWTVYRDKLVNMTYAECQEYGVAAAIDKNPYFKSFREVIIAAFGAHFEITEEHFEHKKNRPPKDWSTRAATIKHAQEEIREALKIPANIKKDPKPEETKERLIAITLDEFKAMGLRGAYYRNKFFKSYMDVVAAAFGKAYGFSAQDMRDARKPMDVSTKAIIHSHIIERVLGGRAVDSYVVDTEEWREMRIKLIEMGYDEYNGYGLEKTIRHADFYDSHIDALPAALGKHFKFTAADKRQHIGLRRVEHLNK